MPPLVAILITSISIWFRSRLSMQMEFIALRHQVSVYQQSVSRPKLRPSARLLWAWLSRLWPGWYQALAFVQPRIVLNWQKKRFRDHWRGLNQKSQPGRPKPRPLNLSQFVEAQKREKKRRQVIATATEDSANLLHYLRLCHFLAVK